MKPIQFSPLAVPPSSFHRAEGAPLAPAQGNLQGRDVKALPHAQSICAAPAKPQAATPLRTLEQLLARSANSSPALLRQARFGALPSVTQLLLPGAGAVKVVQAKSLPSVGDFIASAGKPKSDGLFQRFLNLFRSEKPPDPYKNVLQDLQSYHDSCHIGSPATSLYWLDQLAAKVVGYLKSNDHDANRLGMVKDLHKQLGSERAMLMNLQTELESTPWPSGCFLSDVLSFAREGVSLKEVAHLIDMGLQLEEPRTAREILEQDKLSTAKESLPSGHRKILVDLENYHATCAEHFTEDGKLIYTPVADLAMARLKELDKTAQAYLKDNQGTDAQTQAFKDLRDQISIERQVLQGLIDELGEDGVLPEGADLTHALAFAREGVSLKDMARLMDKGLLASQAPEARMLLDSERSTAIMNELRSLPPEQKAQLESGYSENEILLLANSGLGIEGGAEYRRLGIPITPQTVAIEHTDAQRLGDMTPLGSGAFNAVYVARYGGPEGVVNGVFKPLSNTERGWVAEEIGIDLKQPRIANRNLATQDLARALGFDVVVECQIGARRQPENQQLQLGLVMGRAAGETAFKTPASTFALPEVRREITKLQLLDHLVGQGDRHAGNYFIHTYVDESGQTRAKVSGIDNDQCFGQNTLHGNDIHYSPAVERKGFRGTKMPELIDTDMAAAMRSLTPQSLATLLGDKLNAAELAATSMRLQSLLNHLDHLERNQQIITPAEWNARSDLDDYHKPGNSYFGRDAGRARVAF